MISSEQNGDNWLFNGEFKDNQERKKFIQLVLRNK